MGALRSTRSCSPCFSAVGLLPCGMYAMRTLAARCWQRNISGRDPCRVVHL